MCEALCVANIYIYIYICALSAQVVRLFGVCGASLRILLPGVIFSSGLFFFVTAAGSQIISYIVCKYNTNTIHVRNTGKAGMDMFVISQLPNP